MFASSVVVENQKGEILLVKESAAEVYGKYNLPGGHAHPDESPAACASRELFEEVSLNLLPTSLIGIYRHKRGLNLVFHVDLIGNQEARPSADDVLACEWMAKDCVAMLADEQVLRYVKLMMILDDLKAGRMYPVDVLRDVPSESWECD